MHGLARRFGGAAWITLAHGIHGMFQWVLAILLSRLFGIGDLGLYSAIMAVVTPVVLVGGLNSRGIQLADVGESWSLRQILATRLAGMGLALAVILLYAFTLGEAYALPIWLIVFGRSAAEALSEPLLTSLIAARKYRTFATSFALRSVGSVVAFVVLAAMGASLTVALTGWMLVWFIVFFFRDLRINSVGLLSRVSPGGIGKAIQFARASLPLAVVGVMNALYASVPLTLLQHLRGLHEVGTYSAVVYVNTAVGLVVGAVTLSSARTFAADYREGRTRLALRRVHRQLLFVTAFTTPIVLVMALFGRPILSAVYGTSMAGYGSVIVVQLLAVVVRLAGNVCGVAATSAGMNRSQAQVGFLCLLILIVACLALIGNYGALGASVATLIALAFKFTLIYGTLRLRAGTL